MGVPVPRMALLELILALGVATTRADTVPAEQTHSKDAPASSVLASPGVDKAQRSALPADDPWSSPEIAAPRMDARPLERGRGAASRSADTRSPEQRASGAWLRTTLSLGGVVGLIMLLAFGYRRMAASGGGLKFALRAKHAALIEVVGRTALSPRQSVCLVRVGPRLLLLGCTPDSVRTLDVINDADLTARLLGQAAQQRPDSHTAEFARCLKEEAKAGPGDAGLPEETLAPDEARLSEIREKLNGTIRRLQATGRQQGNELGIRQRGDEVTGRLSVSG